ncbi:MAG TPA: hypothetical protein VHV57_15110 [Acidimicrobiales bacterium]|jgi:hypothetical protein|nr:hypothetical protein [Acidimicrobiales bacterium]
MPPTDLALDGNVPRSHTPFGKVKPPAQLVENVNVVGLTVMLLVAAGATLMVAVLDPELAAKAGVVVNPVSAKTEIANGSSRRNVDPSENLGRWVVSSRTIRTRLSVSNVGIFPIFPPSGSPVPRGCPNSGT